MTNIPAYQLSQQAAVIQAWRQLSSLHPSRSWLSLLIQLLLRPFLILFFSQQIIRFFYKAANYFRMCGKISLPLLGSYVPPLLHSMVWLSKMFCPQSRIWETQANPTLPLQNCVHYNKLPHHNTTKLWIYWHFGIATRWIVNYNTG